MKFEPARNDTEPSAERVKPEETQGNKIDETKDKPGTVAKLEKVLAAAPPNCVVIATPQGDVLKSFRLNDSTLEKYSSFEKYVAALSEAPEKKPCKRTSDECVLCPNGRIYCTNAVKYRVKKLNTF